jgi:hypothetical protein
MILSDHLEGLRQTPCMACGCIGVQLHHAGGGSMRYRGVHKAAAAKVSDWLQIPLCEKHHTGEEGIHRIGTSTWEEKFGGQAAMLDKLCVKTNLDLWALGGQPLKRNKYQRPLKINAWR